MEEKPDRNSVQEWALGLVESAEVIAIGESPIDELELKLKDDPADFKEIKYLLGGILTYPSTELARLHKHSNRLGTSDLRDDHQDNLLFADMK